MPLFRCNRRPCPAASSCNGIKKIARDMGIVKVDLLGLGMMAVLEDSIALIREHSREDVDLAIFRRTTLPCTRLCKRATPSDCFRWKAAPRCRACLA